MAKRNTRLRALASQLQAEPTAELSTSSPVRPQPARVGRDQRLRASCR